jgi:ribose transport system substrate-binding protein
VKAVGGPHRAGRPATRRTVSALVAVALAATAISACGGTLAPNATKGLRIAFIPKSLNQEYWVNTRHGAEAGGQAVHAKVLTGAPQSDTHIDEQINIVQDMLAEKVSALVIAPNDSNLLQPILDQAAKKIPVVLFDSDIAGWAPKTAYVGTQNYAGGVLMGKFLAQQIPGGTLAIITGIPGSQVGIDRVNGVMAGIKGANIKVVKQVNGNFDRQQSVGAMEDILQTNPHLGALQSLDARQLTAKVKLVGFDGALEATQQIIAKKMYATVAQAPYDMGQIGVEEAAAAVEHKPVRKNVDTGARLVTQQNAQVYFNAVQSKLGGGTLKNNSG